MRRNLLIDGRILSCEVIGRGEPIVWLHGYPLDHRMWTPLANELADDFMSIAIDFPGFGGSENLLSEYSMASLADEVAAVIGKLEVATPFVLGGLSMGGYVAWQLWQRHRKMVKSLILCDTRAASDTPEIAESRRKVAADVKQLGTEVIVAPMLKRLLSEQSRLELPEVVELMQSMMFGVPPTTISAAQLAMADREDFTERLSQIDLPSLLVVGELDEISTPREMKTVAEKMPRSRIVEIPKAGHMAPLEQPAVVAEVVREFLATGSN